MVQVKIRPFRGLRDGKEDPQEYIETSGGPTRRSTKARESPTSSIEARAYRLLFRQNLEDDAYVWYSDLDSDNMKKQFLAYYDITKKDSQA